MLRRLPDPSDTPWCTLWRADLDAPLPDGWAASLSADELARAERFRFPVHCSRFISGRAALRHVLSDRIGMAPGDLQFVYNESGKPALSGPATCAFNLSHCDDVAVIALAPAGHHIGVDVERVRLMPDAFALARANFTAKECQSIGGLQEPERSRSFLGCWTRKEACLKAIGIGLGIDPWAFHAGIEEEEMTLSVPVGDRSTSVSVRNIEAGASVVAALAWVAASRPT